MALGNGLVSCSDKGTIAPMLISINLLRASRASLSSTGGSSRNKIESTVARSLKGIPTASFAASDL
uniref:Uncharacterized protein n=1 Tax=Rhizophora mucronata TaxID=61149 RepID=A0A2P2NSZ8_RHIMU